MMAIIRISGGEKTRASLASSLIMSQPPHIRPRENRYSPDLFQPSRLDATRRQERALNPLRRAQRWTSILAMNH